MALISTSKLFSLDDEVHLAGALFTGTETGGICAEMTVEAETAGGVNFVSCDKGGVRGDIIVAAVVAAVVVVTIPGPTFMDTFCDQFTVEMPCAFFFSLDPLLCLCSFLMLTALISLGLYFWMIGTRGFDCVD